tara:strand:- start:112 stop:387 length:276 start_codon:yes stop_codon:yes gene_type:complete
MIKNQYKLFYMNSYLNDELPKNIKLNKQLFQKMLFITNALEQGWTVKKSKDSYIFTKKHENKKEIFQENYLESFVAKNFSTDFVLHNNEGE